MSRMWGLLDLGYSSLLCNGVTLMETLTKFATDPYVETRALYGHVLYEGIRVKNVKLIVANIHDIVSTLIMVSEDKEQQVRIALVKIIPYIYLVCHEMKPELEDYLYDRLLQIVLLYRDNTEGELGELVAQVADTALHQLLQRNLIDPQRLEEKVCPFFFRMLSKAFDGERESFNDLIILMGRIAKSLGPEGTKKLLLDKFMEMCTSERNGLRRSCAIEFPTFCKVVGVKATEMRMLPFFFQLCEDPFWGVRKACSETIVMVSLSCSLECRRERITPIVLKLLNDASKWVVGSTLKVLGQFISTFAEPDLTCLVYSNDGFLQLVNLKDKDLEGTEEYEMISKGYRPLITKHLQMQPDETANSDTLKHEWSTEEISKKIIECKAHIISLFTATIDFGSINIEISARDRRQSYASLKNQEDREDDSAIGYIYGSDFRINGINMAPLPETFDFGHLSKLDDDDDAVDGIIGENVGSAFDIPVDSFDEKINDNNAEVKTETEVSHDSTVATNSSSCSESHLWRKNTPADLPSIIKEAISVSQDTSPIPNRKRSSAVISQCNMKLSLPKLENLSLETPLVEKSEMIFGANFYDQLLCSSFNERDDPITNSNETEITCNEISSNMNCTESSPSPTATDNDQNAFVEEDDAFKNFNSHKFWYIEPELPLDVELIHPENSKIDNQLIGSGSIKLKVRKFRDRIRDIPLSNLLSKNSIFKPPSDYNQNIVPVKILQSYVEMVLLEEDEEINFNCAYHFPAVALTIGKTNWHIVKPLFEYLCDDLDWKVRRITALSVGSLAKILGPEIATEDLVPIYLRFFKDVDEVKIEAVKKFSIISSFVKSTALEELISNIGTCLRVDGKTNWRISEELAKQILEIVQDYKTFKPDEIFWKLTSLTALFLEDKISCVREIAAVTMATIISKSGEDIQTGIAKYLIQEFAISDQWRKRQTFLFVILNLTQMETDWKKSFPLVKNEFGALSVDNVANIRLLVAKILTKLAKLDETFLTENKDVEAIISRLRLDNDRDVACTITSNDPEPENVRSDDCDGGRIIEW